VDYDCNSWRKLVDVGRYECTHTNGTATEHAHDSPEQEGVSAWSIGVLFDAEGSSEGAFG
jgi:hypothetical protein